MLHAVVGEAGELPQLLSGLEVRQVVSLAVAANENPKLVLNRAEHLKYEKS